MNLRRIGEDRLLQRLLPKFKTGRDVVVPAGDDCAVVKIPGADDLVLLKTDCVVENVHFRSQDPAATVGWKAMMRPLSDFAAMSGLPRFALVTLIVPAATTLAKIDNLYRGLRRAAAKFGVQIVGGETSGTRGPIVISVSVIGVVEENRLVSRCGARSGDDLFVTGKLGGAGKVKHLRFVPRIAESRWLTANFRLHAMMDLSDGLAVDLPRLAKSSRVSFKVDVDKIPRTAGCNIDNALGDGEDYELLFTISPRVSSRLQRAWKRKFSKLPLTRIGCLTQLLNNSTSQLLPGGFVHFE